MDLKALTDTRNTCEHPSSCNTLQVPSFMPISVLCHRCDNRMRIRDELAGKRFKCKECGTVLTAGRSGTDSRDKQQATKRRKPKKPGRRRPAGRSQRGASEETFAGIGSYGTAIENPVRKQKKRYAGPSRDSHPEEFAEFDRIALEVAIFYIGFALIIAGLGSAIFFMDNNPSDPERHRIAFSIFLISASVMLVMGLLCFTKNRFIFQGLQVLSFILGAFSGLIALMTSKLMLIVPFSLIAAGSRLGKAVNVHPE